MRRLLLLASLALPAQDLRMNQIQFIGTHNSYHIGLSPAELALLEKQNPQAAASLAYKHAPIEAQLDAGARQLELDIFHDSKGGLFANPLYLRLAPNNDPMPPAWTEAMQKPGFKVLHVNDLDFRSHCWTLTACLQTVRAWSKAHPKHLPIYVQLENKDGRPRPEFVLPEPITAQPMDALDAEILSVFSKKELITPDDVRGKHKTLEAAVLAQGWPKLSQARGKVVFLLDQERVTPLYTAGRPSLEGRVVFTAAKPGSPDAAFIKRNNATAADIPELVRKGYLIRTMTDGGVKAVLSNDTTRRDLAINSGAHILSTDYPFNWKAAPSGYSVSLPEGKVRCNPINSPKPCSVPLPH